MTSYNRSILSGAALLALTACDRPLDLDMRDLGGGFSTTEAALAAPSRPRPDSRGLISTPEYQVAVAQQNDTVTSISARLGLNAQEVAAYNGVQPDAVLRRDEIVALPRRVVEGTAPPASVTTLASAAIGRATAAGPVTTTPLGGTAAPAAPAPFGTAQGGGTEPVRHQVAPGETAYSVARLYGVPVRTIADWNGLGTDLAVREGQYLLVPPATGQAAPPVLAPPGAGSATPVPPSASAPLPQETPLPAAEAVPQPVAAPQDLGAQQETTADAALVMPVQGSIIRAYAPGRNEGIDIAAAEGTEVKAADAGTVAAVTTNTDGVQIVVIRHANELLTVYTNLDRLTVAKDAQVTRGQTIGRVRAGDPSFLHFEVRRGMASTDPMTLLP